MAIAHDPSVLLLDEPSSGIAQRETEALGPLLQRIQAETGCAMLVIEHDMPLITAVSDEMIALELGAVVVQGTPARGHQQPAGDLGVPRRRHRRHQPLGRQRQRRGRQGHAVHQDCGEEARGEEDREEDRRGRQVIRRLARLAAGVCLLMGVAVVVAPPASAVLPDKVGWWNKLQQIPILPTVGPVNLPLPPVVSTDDLPVVGDVTPDGFIIAAVRYLVPSGASARLTLVDTDDRPIVMPPGASILACPTTSIWDGLINGRWDSRPKYDCAALSVQSTPTEDRLGFTWDLPASFQTSPGAIDIALVPSGPLPFAAVFAGPTDRVARADRRSRRVG